MFNIVNSFYGKKFKSLYLNSMKYSELIEVAKQLREFRNSLSVYYWTNFEKYINMSSNDFLKEIRRDFEIKLCSNFDYDQITAVHTAYKNRTNGIIRRISFEPCIFGGIEKYNSNTKYHKKGEFKCFVYKRNKTRISTVLTYLARYGNEKTVDYISNQLENNQELKNDKRLFYENILEVIAKFGFERLFKLALQRRIRVYDSYRRREPIKFESLTFGGRSRKSELLVYNDNFNSEIKAFVLLSWTDRKCLAIPVKYSKKIHGDMKLYNLKTSNFQYEISFDEKHKEIFVHCGIPGEREVFDARACKEFIAVDENLKHNMYTLSSEIEDKNGNKIDNVDYDRDLIDEFIKFQKKLESYKEKDSHYTMGKKMRQKSESLKRRMISSERETIAFMCEAIKKAGFNHIVAEDLSGGFGKNYSKDEYGINYNTLLNFVHFNTLPDELIRIAHKHGVAVSFVHAAYTSQMCPKCGHIHKNNRKSQEQFKCEKCGYESNADVNSSGNILNRVLSDVLTRKLLKQNDNGEYVPKKMKRESIK